MGGGSDSAIVGSSWTKQAVCAVTAKHGHHHRTLALHTLLLLLRRCQWLPVLLLKPPTWLNPVARISPLSSMSSTFISFPWPLGALALEYVRSLRFATRTQIVHLGWVSASEQSDGDARWRGRVS